MAPAQSTVIPTPTSNLSTKPPSHTNQISIPAMIALALLLLMMAALTVGVILRQRRAMRALKKKRGELQEKSPSSTSGRTPWSLLTRFKPKAIACTEEHVTAVGALHAASVLVAAAPHKMFTPPVRIQFRVPLEDKTVIILGLPWPPPQSYETPMNDHQTYVGNDDDSQSPAVPESAVLDDPLLGPSARGLEDSTIHHFATGITNSSI